MKSVLILCVTFLVRVQSLKFPNDIERCKAADTECLPKIITQVIARVSDGHPGLNLPPIDPLHVDEINISQGKDSPVNIDLILKDTDLIGLHNVVISKVKGFTKNPSETIFEVIAKAPQIQLIGKYKINGRVLILPIQGAGNSNLTLDNLDIQIKFTTNQTIKNSKNFIQTNKFKFSFQTSRLYINFSGLFNGDKALGDNMNAFLNENWQDILQELKPSINDALSQIISNIINRVFSKIAYSDIYLD